MSLLTQGLSSTSQHTLITDGLAAFPLLEESQVFICPPALNWRPILCPAISSEEIAQPRILWRFISPPSVATVAIAGPDLLEKVVPSPLMGWNDCESGISPTLKWRSILSPSLSSQEMEQPQLVWLNSLPPEISAADDSPPELLEKPVSSTTLTWSTCYGDTEQC